MQRVICETVTPVHIGSGLNLQRQIEFLADGNEIALVDDRKVLSIIGSEHIDTWVHIIERGDNLLAYLRTRKPDLKLNDVAKRVLKIHGDTGNIQFLREQMHNGTGEAMIPGSSLKGAFRTAFLNNWLKQHPRLWEKDKLGLNKKKKFEFKDNRVVENCFGKDPNHDLLRFLQVGDLHFQGSTEAMVLDTMNYTNQGIMYKKAVRQLVEIIPAGSVAETGMQIRKTHLRKNLESGWIRNEPDYLKNMHSLFSEVNSHTLDLLQKEIEFWDEDRGESIVDGYLNTLESLHEKAASMDENSCLVRVGFGSGWTFMTGAWIKNEELVADSVYEEILYQARPGNKRYQNMFFPKTRKMHSDFHLPGFVRLSIPAS